MKIDLESVGIKLLYRTFFLLFITLNFTVSSQAASVDPVHEDLALLEKGEILIQTILSDKSGGAARVTALFHSQPQAIWNIIGHCEYEYIYVRGLKLCEVLVFGMDHTEVRHRVRSSWYTPTMDFTFEASRTSPTHGDFQLLGGDLKVMEGQWNFLPLADAGGIIVVHEIRIRSRFPAPRWLVRRVLKNDLPDMLACIRGLAKASGDEGRIASDLERCPGEANQADK